MQSSNPDNLSNMPVEFRIRSLPVAVLQQHHPFAPLLEGLKPVLFAQIAGKMIGAFDAPG
jgi:hypothetical protein